MDKFERFYGAAEQFLVHLVKNDLNPEDLQLHDDISYIPEIQVQVEDMDDETINCVLIVSKHSADGDFQPPKRETVFGVVRQLADEVRVHALYFYENSIWDINPLEDDETEIMSLDDVSRIFETLVERYSKPT